MLSHRARTILCGTRVVAVAIWLLRLSPVCAAARQPPAALEQIEAEQRAIRLVGRADVQAALPQLEAAWRRGTPGLLPETVGQLHASIEEVLFMVALEIVDGDARRPHVVEISAPPHRWFGTAVPGGRWGINNPDTLYFTVPIEPGSRYVVTGRRRSPGPADSNFTVQTPDVWGAVGNIGQRDLKIDADGSYRITIDDRPGDGTANHLQIKGGATALLIRNTLRDWHRELPDIIAVARISGPPAGTVPSDRELARELTARMARVIAHSVNDLQPPLFRLQPNVIPQPGKLADKPGFLVTQRNALGHFRLADDEALVATINPGGAGYSTFPVTSMWGISPDSRTHQTSLNDWQAAPNADGTFTIVLSNWDPGVANWIDPAGLREGIIMLRWQKLARQPLSGGPAVTSRLVKRDALSGALPPGMIYVTKTERKARLARRGADFDRRFAEHYP